MLKDKIDPAYHQKRKWLDWKMEIALDGVQNGESIYSAAKRWEVSYTTLRSRFLGTPIRPQLGPKPVFTLEEQRMMRIYITDCTVLGIPVTQQHMAMDVKHYATIKGKETPFKFGIPGTAWFYGLLHLDDIEMILVSQEEKNKIMSRLITIPEFTMARRNYIRNQNGGKLLDDQRQVYLVEVESLSLQTTTNKKVTTVICSNANGEMLTPTILHNGEIDAALEGIYKQKLKFIKTENGNMDRPTLMKIVEDIHTNMQENNIQTPLVVNFTPEAAEYFSFACWLLLQDYNIIPAMIPLNVQNTLKTKAFGVFSKVTPHFDNIVTWRYVQPNIPCTVRLFPALFWQSKMKVKLTSGIKKSFTSMQLRDLNRRRRCAIQEMIEDERTGDQYNVPDTNEEHTVLVHEEDTFDDQQQAEMRVHPREATPHLTFPRTNERDVFPKRQQITHKVTQANKVTQT